MSKNGSKRLGANVAIPYINTEEDGSTTRNWARLSFTGPVDRRRVKREIRKWIKRALHRNVDQNTLRQIAKQVNYY